MIVNVNLFTCLYLSVVCSISLTFLSMIFGIIMSTDCFHVVTFIGEPLRFVTCISNTFINIKQSVSNTYKQ